MVNSVTTIIANYNYGKYLQDCLTGCFNQTVDNFVVVGDDFSSDNSRDIVIKNLSPILSIEEINGIKIYKFKKGMLVSFPKNVGPSVVRNACIQLNLNNSKYFNIVDADDIPKENKIERMLKEFSDKVGVVYADYDILNEKNQTLLREYKKSFSYEKLLSECIVHSGSMIKKEALISVFENGGFYDQLMRTCEDYDLWIRIADKGWQIKHVAESLSIVRDHEQNSTNTQSKEVWQSNWNRIIAKRQRLK